MQSFSFLFRKSKLLMLRKFSAHVLYVRHLFYLHPDDWPNQSSLHDIILVPWCNEDGKEGITWLKGVCCRVWYIDNFAVSLPRRRDPKTPGEVSSTSTTCMLCYAMDAKRASLLVSSAKQLLQGGAGLSERKSKFIACRGLKWIVPMWSLCMVACMQQWIFVWIELSHWRLSRSSPIRKRKMGEDGTRVVSNFLYDHLCFGVELLFSCMRSKSAHVQLLCFR
jgi:hypothetical protein